MRCGLVADPLVDYLIVQNIPEWPRDHKLEMNEKPMGRSNVTWVKRPNVSQDIGAYSEAVRIVDTSKYDYFLFINSTMRGPFLPTWFDHKKSTWVDSFVGMLNDSVALAGCSINYYGGRPHVQSMAMVMDHRALKIYKDRGIFLRKNMSIPKHVLIDEHEVGGSKYVLEEGYNIDCFVTAFVHKDWRKDVRFYPEEASDPNDLWGSKNYYGYSLHPYETIFYKTNRHYNRKDCIIDLMSEWWENIEYMSSPTTTNARTMHPADEVLDDTDYVAPTTENFSVPKTREEIQWIIITSVLSVVVLVLIMVICLRK